MNAIIRTDASINIGTGHLMRCLTLADELKQRGADISFICREEPGNLIDFIESKGYKVYHLPPGIDIQKDSRLCVDHLKERKDINWLIVDHYELGAEWESFCRNFTNRIMVIDDLANRQHDCDLLLDQNLSFNEERYKGLLPDRCIQLLGPEYVLLRPQFRRVRESSRTRNGKVKRILVFMGGADHNNLTCKVLQALRILNCSELIIDVVIGASNLHRDEIEKLSSRIPNTSCHFNVNNMAELMEHADLSIGAAGTTSWERCCLGLPSLTIIIADNQKDIACSLDKEGCCINLGWYEETKAEDIRNCIEDLLRNSERLISMSKKNLNLVDGLGSERVSEVLFDA